MLAGLYVSNSMRGTKPSAAAAAVSIARSRLSAGRQTNGSSRTAASAAPRAAANGWPGEVTSTRLSDSSGRA